MTSCTCTRCGRDVPNGAQVVTTAAGLCHAGCADELNQTPAVVTYGSQPRSIVGWLDVLPLGVDFMQALKMSKTDVKQVDVGLCGATNSVALRLALDDGRVAEVVIGAPWWHALEHRLAQLRAEQRG